jgi:hypothetical protein
MSPARRFRVQPPRKGVFHPSQQGVPRVRRRRPGQGDEAWEAKPLGLDRSSISTRSWERSHR